MAEHFAAGHYKPLPVVTFPMGSIKEALELMKSGRHVGKVVLVNHDEEGRECPVMVERPQATFRPDIAYLVTGGAGGFGQKLIGYAILQGARRFVITTSREDVEAVRASMRTVLELAPGVELDVVRCDTAKVDDIERLLEHARQVQPPVKAIFHAAGVPGDVRLMDMVDRESFEKTAR